MREQVAGRADGEGGLAKQRGSRAVVVRPRDSGAWRAVPGGEHPVGLLVLRSHERDTCGMFRSLAQVHSGEARASACFGRAEHSRHSALAGLDLVEVRPLASTDMVGKERVDQPTETTATESSFETQPTKEG